MFRDCKQIFRSQKISACEDSCEYNVNQRGDSLSAADGSGGLWVRLAVGTDSYAFRNYGGFQTVSDDLHNGPAFSIFLLFLASASVIFKSNKYFTNSSLGNSSIL